MPVATIAEWCDISESTAKSLKGGWANPSASVVKLMKLHLEGRILTDEWRGWGVLRGKLCDPEGHETTQAQLRAYPIVYALANEYGKTNSRASDTLFRLASMDYPQQLRPKGGARPPLRGSSNADAPPTASFRTGSFSRRAGSCGKLRCR